MTKIQILSDLHLEFVGQSYVPGKTNADIVVMAGDLDNGKYGVSWLAKNFPNQEVVYIAGNHEFYNWPTPMQETYADLAAESNKPEHIGVNFLQNETIVIDGVRFICATLWTDFKIDGNEVLAELCAQGSMNDYKMSAYGSPGQRLNPWHTKQEFAISKKFIVDELAKDFAGATVVVTHHIPSPSSIHPMYQNDNLNPAFASNLDAVIYQFQPTLWVHGHTHCSFDYTLGNTRVVCNPMGYGRPNRADSENPYFIPDLVVNV